jgi:hypothetical protein
MEKIAQLIALKGSPTFIELNGSIYIYARFNKN